MAETDLMGVVHHASYLVYLELARIELLRSCGVTYADIIQKGVHFPVVDARIRYHKSARYDDELELECWLAEMSRVSLRFDFRTWCKGMKLNEATIYVACVDDEGAPQAIPDDIAAAIEGT